MENIHKSAPIGKRDPLIDILKGIGIVSVVVGHAGILFPGGNFIPSTQFVYLYHLMIFFFAAGAVYSPEKYADPYIYIGRQLKGSLPLYWAYTFLFLALHNLLSKAQLLDIPVLSLNDAVIQCSSAFICAHTEQLTGTLWFVPMLLVAKILFSVSFQLAEKCKKYKILVHCVVVCFFAALGLYTNHWGMYFTYHIQTAFLGIPIIYLGYVFSRYRHCITKYANIFTCILSAVLMLIFLRLNIGSVELSINSIINPYLFYPVTTLGLFFAVSLGAVIQRSKRITGCFSYLGSISFHIMALHFLAFKLFDWSYGLLRGMDRSEIMRFPTMLGNIGLVYSVIGVVLPAVAVWLVQKYLSKRKNLQQNSCERKEAKQ